jgi:hypothetical protein
MNQKNETVGRQKLFLIYPYLMLIPYQTALYILKPQFHFLLDQLGHSFTIIGYEAIQNLYIQILLDAHHSVIPKTKLDYRRAPHLQGQRLALSGLET